MTDLKCPVCGKYTFQEKNDYDICKYCGWENDGFYDCGGANRLSLSDYTVRYNRYVELYPGYIWTEFGYPEISEEDIDD
jgi:hypothetical protein